MEWKSLRRTESVSYTHLDVYKRQEQDTTCRKYENNITFVHNRFNPILKVVGKWRELSMNSEFYVNSKNKIAISNEKNEVLHLIVAKHHSCKLCKEGNKDMLHKHCLLYTSRCV